MARTCMQLLGGPRQRGGAWKLKRNRSGLIQRIINTSCINLKPQGLIGDVRGGVRRTRNGDDGTIFSPEGPTGRFTLRWGAIILQITNVSATCRLYRIPSARLHPFWALFHSLIAEISPIRRSPFYFGSSPQQAGAFLVKVIHWI